MIQQVGVLVFLEIVVVRITVVNVHSDMSVAHLRAVAWLRSICGWCLPVQLDDPLESCP